MKQSKFLLLLIILGMIGVSVLAAAPRQLVVSASPNQTLLAGNDRNGFEVRFRVGELNINEVKTKGGAFDELSIEGYGFTNRLGEPKLPVVSKLVAVPLEATISFDVLQRDYQSLDAERSQLTNRIIPAQRSVSKSEDPALVPFELKESAYSLDTFTDNEMFRVEEIGIMRGVRIFQIYYEPVRYNPITGELQVSNDVLVRVDFTGSDFAATEALLARTTSWEFNQLYRKILFNWDNDRDSIELIPSGMVILCPDGSSTNSYVEAFKNWKVQQGFIVTVQEVGGSGDIANTTTEIKNYLQGLYNGVNPPTYLLIIGDESGTFSITENTGSTGSHPTDLNYVRLNGTDYLPELYFGRFSVRSVAELANIVEKTLQFEQTTMPNTAYLGEVVLIAGVDASYAPTYGNGQINYGLNNYFINDTHGFSSNGVHSYLYPASDGAGVPAAIIGYMNSGIGYVNYTAHGSQTSWADPYVGTSDLSSLSNLNEYFVAVGNCCVTNQFTTETCFGEQMIKLPDKAAVGYIGGTNNTYWDEDYWWAVGGGKSIVADGPPYNANALGAYDAMFHSHGEGRADWATTLGETVYMGNSAVQQSGSSRANYYWEIYSIMGDPSLMPYYGVPDDITVNTISPIQVGQSTISIQTDAPYARIAFSVGSTLYATGIANGNGDLTLNNPFNAPVTATLVITAQNYVTHIDNSIQVISASGPYMTVVGDETDYDDGGNDIPEYNESAYLDVTFKNAGTETAASVTATLTCGNPYISLIDDTDGVFNLGPDATILRNDAFRFSIADGIPNDTQIDFTFNMDTNPSEGPWEAQYSLTVKAPDLEFGNITIQDPTGNNNGRLDPGETVTITIPLNNDGGAASQSGSTTMQCTTEGITVTDGSDTFTAIAAAGNASLSFTLTAASNMDIGTVVSLQFDAVAGAYSAEKDETASVGIVIEDFESGDFSSFDWTFGGTLPWVIVSTGAYAGTYCAKSGAITHSQTSTMELERTISTDEEISFWYKVSSESGWDYLKFYIDGVIQNSPGWAGEIGWTQASYIIPAGTRTLKWEYYKDGSVSSGSDCAWVDDILFEPYIPPTITWNPSSLSQELNPDGTASQNLTIGNTGTQTLDYTVSKPTSSTTVMDETFATTSIPTGWTQEYVSGSLSWIFATGGYNNTHPSAAYDGAYNARLYNSSSYTTKLVTPSLNLSGSSSATLTFWHTQEAWYSDQDLLNVYYKTSSGGTWTLLQGYTTSVATWTQRTITLPNPSGTYYVAFEGITDYGYGVCVDKVVVSKTGGVSVPWLTVAGGDSYSGSIANGEAEENVSIGFNATGLSVGTYNSTLTLTSNDPENPSINIPVTLNVTNTSAPEIVVSPLSLDFGSVAVGSNSQQQFTIQNTGSAELTGNITTPLGYSVAEAARSAKSELPEDRLATAGRNTLSYTVGSGLAKTYNLTFTPGSTLNYQGNVVITSNDSDEPTTNIAVTGTGYIPNHAPSIILPASFSFDKNGSLVVDFSAYADDEDDDPLELDCSGSTNLNVAINGLQVTFSTAAQNWTGAETVTFSVTDGTDTDYDDVGVIVNPTNAPAWQVVTYPNNSATVYGVATLDWTACQLNDWVGVFVGGECRGLAEVTVSEGVAYVTLLANLASSGETASFMVYDYSTDTIYPVLETYALEFGEELGPIPVNGVSTVELDAPVVTIERAETGISLSWEAVDYADSYYVFRSTSDPYSGFTQVATVTGLTYNDTDAHDRAFYYVKAVRSLAARH